MISHIWNQQDFSKKKLNLNYGQNMLPINFANDNTEQVNIVDKV